MSDRTSAPGPSVVVIDGNPQPSSRTASVGRRLGERLAELVAGGSPDQAGRVELVSLSELGPGLLQWGDESVARAKALVLSATIVVVATPTYKATYTGLLKLFLDQFGAGELAHVRAVVPLMTGGGPGHSLAVDVHLRPVLVEIGARVPTAGLYVWGEQIDEPDEVLEAWLATETEVVRRQLG
ncbi:MAG: NAD(P)H-dependent oxidoreductase [Actinomycetota bacterium]|nr:NAD(P)H-dependent oxidoreductase [Actinomycetota bacterium]